MQTVILVHGGAGAWDGQSSRVEAGQKACVAAAVAGQAVLLAGGSALDAVETAVNILEDAPALDAGTGSYLNTAGEVELDALIMNGRNLALGAIAGVQRVQYPISLARKVMEKCAHNMLVGKGAEQFADSISFPRCAESDLHINEQLFDTATSATNTHANAPLNVQDSGSLGDTVGAVALDAQGNMATATSTGGTQGKLPGRVGDSPLVGSGGYADNRTAAVSATGEGEKLMQIVISKQVCDFVAAGLSAKAACEAAIQLLAERTQGEGGLIAVDALGRVGVAFNTSAMPHAYAIGEGAVVDGR